MKRWQRFIRRFVFGDLPADADGWFVWRNSPWWPKDCYRCIEIANGVMVDVEPADSYGAVWNVVECNPYGQFRGPILGR